MRPINAAPIAAAMLAAGLLVGCANPFAAEPALDAGPSRELAERPVELGGGSQDPAEAASEERGSGNADVDAMGAGEDARNEGDPGDVAASSGGGPSPGSSGAGEGGRSGSVEAVADASGDHGLRAPDYADLVRLALEDRGGVLRLAVTVDGPIPERLPEDEVQGIGIDLYRPSARESSYQVFVDGSAEGWFAYFSTPGGFRRFPGSFALGGDRMVFEVPWSSLRALGERFEFRAFCDWTERTTGVVNLFAEDHAPGGGRATFRR